MHIALAVYDPSGTYSQHAGVTITSIFENTKSRVIVHVLHDETLTPENRKKFIRTAEKYSQVIELHDVTEHKSHISEETIRIARPYTIGIFYRLFIPEILPALSKLLYLDCDVLVNLDIRELWNIDLENFCMAGVHDVSAVGFGEGLRERLNDSRLDAYINSGVIAMNLDAIREKGNLFQNSMNWFASHKHLIRFGDQDIINGLFYQSIKLIDRRFNNICPQTEQEMQDSIIHGAGFDRPWELTGLPYQRLYWQTYLKSAWGEGQSCEELVDAMCAVAGKNKYMRLFERLKPKLKTITQPLLAVKYILKELRHRLKH